MTTEAIVVIVIAVFFATLITVLILRHNNKQWETVHAIKRKMNYLKNGHQLDTPKDIENFYTYLNKCKKDEDILDRI